MNLLCRDASGRWYWTADGIKPDPTHSLSLIGLRWLLKSNISVNYVLGFASIATMPRTRQSPFVALFLPIREEKLTPCHREDGRIQVHLADLDSMLQPQGKHDTVRDATMKARDNLVEPHMDAAAKARVTFAVSPLSAESLTSPKKVEIEKEE